MPRLSDEDILATGKWDRRYADVVASVEVADGRVMALIDSNGARGDVPYGWVEWYHRDEQGQWQCGSGSNAVGEGWGWSGGIVYAFGEADSPSVTVEFEGTRYVVPTREHGWWLFAMLAADPDELEAHPRRIE